MAVGLLLFLSAFGAVAQTNDEPASASRYLIIVDTSSAMKRRADATRELLRDLLLNDLNGQLQSDDTIGLWTYDDELHAGEFPMQMWSPGRRYTVAADIESFLKDQRYRQKSTRFTPVLAQVELLVQDSDKLTVLLISDGDEDFTGTPFAKQIATAFQQGYEQQKTARQPFVTVLRTRQGRYLGYNVSVPPWRVEFPVFPEEPKPVAKVTPKASVRPKIEPKPVNSNILTLTVVGEKAEVGYKPKDEPEVVPTPPAVAVNSVSWQSAQCRRSGFARRKLKRKFAVKPGSGTRSGPASDKTRGHDSGGPVGSCRAGKNGNEQST